MELHSCIINENPEEEKDLNLSNLLKNQYCDVTGKKTLLKNAAEILYRTRSPDKLSLTKSAGSFNSVIVRNPFNLFE